jgi:hypothetical protein
MSKLVSILTASMLALTLNGTLLAQQETNRDDTVRQPSETQGGTENDATQGGDAAQGDAAVPDAAQQGDLTEREQEYLSALKKCEPLTGSDKENCIERAKKKHGQM